MSNIWNAGRETRWITSPEIEEQIAAPLLRRKFQVAEAFESAMLYLCGLGYHEAWINGRRVGDHVLDPAQTDYEKRALFVRHDVTELLRAGENAIGVMLGNGFFNQDQVWAPGGLSYGHPRLLAEIQIRYTDGSVQKFGTDKAWRTAAGPVIRNNIYAGEMFDARCEPSGWTLPGCDDSGWTAAVEAAPPGGQLEEQIMPPCRRVETLAPVSIQRNAQGLFTVDFGQNFSGWAKIRLTAPSGTQIRLRFAETLGANGQVNTDSCGVIHTKVEQIDRYTCKGGGEEVWEPRFTCHGFRYVEVSGWPGELTADQISGIVVHTDLPVAGSFECSNDRLNQLHRMALWTHRSNIHGIPEDCPVRERCGWLGDANVVAEFSMWNFNGKAFWEKYLGDIETTRELNGGLPCNIAPGKRTAGTANPDWASAFIMLPWYLYLFYGDAAVISNHWNGMRHLMAHFEASSVDGVLPGGYGDWFDPGGEACCSHTLPELTTTLWFYRCAEVMAACASRLNDAGLQQHYAALTKTIRQGFTARFYNHSLGTFGSQTADAMALHFGIPSAEERPRVLASLLRDIEQRDFHFNVGIMGMRYLFEVLSANGQGDLAIRLLEQNSYPSFGALIRKGATTLWEYWGEEEHDRREGTRSLNHPMMGGYDNWFYNTLAGIRPDPEHPGFKRFILKPCFLQGLEWASATHRSPYGLISSQWKQANGCVTWDVTVPADTTAEVWFKGGDMLASGNPLGSKKQIRFLRVESGFQVYEIPAGIYSFSCVI